MKIWPKLYSVVLKTNVSVECNYDFFESSKPWNSKYCNFLKEYLYIFLQKFHIVEGLELLPLHFLNGRFGHCLVVISCLSKLSSIVPRLIDWKTNVDINWSYRILKIRLTLISMEIWQIVFCKWTAGHSELPWDLVQIWHHQQTQKEGGASLGSSATPSPFGVGPNFYAIFREHWPK